MVTLTTQSPVFSPWFRRQRGPWANISSYSGCDIIPTVLGIDATTKAPKLFVIGDIQTLTYSIHSDKGAVRTLGRKVTKGFTRGNRTIAGTMIFSIFDRRALWELSKNKNETTRRVAIADSLPGFDIVLYFTNEYGQESTLAIYNIQIVDEGQSHSVQDVYIENTMSYIAQDIDLLEPRELNAAGMPSGAVFVREKHEMLNRLAGPGGLAFDYSYLQVAPTVVTTR